MEMVERTTPGRYKLAPYRSEAGIPRDRGKMVVVASYIERCSVFGTHLTENQYRGKLAKVILHLLKAEQIVKKAENNYTQETLLNGTDRYWENQRETWLIKEELELVKMYLECTKTMWHGMIGKYQEVPPELLNCNDVLTQLLRDIAKREEIDLTRIRSLKAGTAHCIHCSSNKSWARTLRDRKERAGSLLCTCEEGCAIPKTSECSKQVCLKLY